MSRYYWRLPRVPRFLIFVVPVIPAFLLIDIFWSKGRESPAWEIIVMFVAISCHRVIEERKRNTKIPGMTDDSKGQQGYWKSGAGGQDFSAASQNSGTYGVSGVDVIQPAEGGGA